MPIYTVYSTATGQVLHVVSCHDSDAEAQAQAGQSVIAGSPPFPAPVPGVLPDAGGFYVSGGAFVSTGAPPGPGYSFDYTAKAWTIALATAQSQALAAVGTWYAAAIVRPVAFTSDDGVAQTYQADSTSQNNLLIATTGYGLAGSTPSGFYWVAQDNTQVPFTLADLKGLYAVMLAQGQSAFVQAQNLKAQIRAATTAAAVAAVVIPAMA